MTNKIIQQDLHRNLYGLEHTLLWHFPPDSLTSMELAAVTAGSHYSLETNALSRWGWSHFTGARKQQLHLVQYQRVSVQVMSVSYLDLFPTPDCFQKQRRFNGAEFLCITLARKTLNRCYWVHKNQHITFIPLQDAIFLWYHSIDGCL